MSKDNILYKIWRIIYPVIIYFLLDCVVVWAVQTVLVSVTPLGQSQNTAVNIPAIAFAVFLAISIPVMYKLYKQDCNGWSVWIYKRPWFFAVAAVMGALASHGLSCLVSLADIDSIIGSYTEIEGTVFSASPWLVILQTVILAPISEELLFRGIIYNRVEKYTGGFWISAAVSSLLFGVYHFNLAQGIFAFLIGMTICAVYVKFRNLWAAIALHAGANLLPVILEYTGFGYSTLWIYIMSMILVLAAAFCVYWFVIRPQGKNNRV